MKDAEIIGKTHGKAARLQDRGREVHPDDPLENRRCGHFCLDDAVLCALERGKSRNRKGIGRSTAGCAGHEGI